MKELAIHAAQLADIALLAAIQSCSRSGYARLWNRPSLIEQRIRCRRHLPAPPTSWATPYEAMAQEKELTWTTLEQLSTVVATFVNPVLNGGGGVCHPAGWNWD
jgi:hypothetical protein